MQALRNGFKLGGRADSEENSQQTESENERYGSNKYQATMRS